MSGLTGSLRSSVARLVPHLSRAAAETREIADARNQTGQAFRLGTRCDAWAVGAGSRLGTDQAIVLHWNGTKWMPVKLTSTLGTETELLNVAGSAGNVWAVGDSTTNDGLAQAFVFHCC
jgi:hypothetical protein